MSLKKLSVRTRAAEMYAVQVIIVLFSVMVKGITRTFPVNLPASCVLLSWHGVRCASSLCLENWLLGLRAQSQNALVSLLKSCKRDGLRRLGAKVVRHKAN